MIFWPHDGLQVGRLSKSLTDPDDRRAKELGEADGKAL